MSKDAFDKIAEGLNEALAFSRAERNMPMVEKVARAILKRLIAEGEYIKDLGDGLIKIDGCVDLPEIARAAIKAMREPTDRMLEAGNIPGWDDSVTVGLMAGNDRRGPE